MTMDVCKTLLHHSEDHHFKVRRQAFAIFGQIQIDLDIAPYLESFNVGTQSSVEAHFIE